MKFFSILVAAVSLVGVSCERHEFEGPNGTKQLNEPHAAAASASEHRAVGRTTPAGGADHAEHPEKKAEH
jgi:hypothetical protein